MSTARARRQAAVSLFAFQDIITSVTAIMILFVLILTLELVSRSQRLGTKAEDRRVARELRAAVDALRSQAESLRGDQEAAAQAALRAAGLSTTEIRRRQDEADRATHLLAEENALLAAQARTALAEQRSAESSLGAQTLADAGDRAAHATAMDQRAAEMEKANHRERGRQESCREVAVLPAAATLVFNPDPESSRQPVLVDVSAHGLAVLDQAGSTRRYDWSSIRPSTDFARWLSGLDADSQYVVILLRPSAIDRDDLVRKAVTDAGLNVGLELVGESTQVAFPASQGEN
jgi:hypothetical protein